jgi:tRNA(fMet)-specific endonuclease VapC
MYLLDTNAWIRYLNPQPSSVKERVNKTPTHSLLLCSVVKSELYYGAYKSTQKERNLLSLEYLFAQFSSIVFDDESARLAGDIRATLANQGTPIGLYDVQIAAIALKHNLILVTHNVGEFSRVQGLNIEDWEI